MDASTIWDALGLSLLVAVAATLVVGVLGTMVGRHLATGSYRGKDILDGITSLPLFLPPTVLGYYLTIIIGRKSFLGELLGEIGIEFTFTWLGAALASGIVAFPLMVRSARIAFEQIEAEVEESAALDGATFWQRWRYLLVPMARGGIAGGLVLSFARAIGEFGATLMLSGNIPGKTQTMPLAIYEAYSVGDDDTALILSGILTFVSLCVVVIGLRLGRES